MPITWFPANFAIWTAMCPSPPAKPQSPKLKHQAEKEKVLALGQRALARVSYVTSTRAKARSPDHSNDPDLRRGMDPFSRD